MLGRIWVKRSGSQNCRFLIHCDEHDQNNVVFFYLSRYIDQPIQCRTKGTAQPIVLGNDVHG